MAKKVKKPDLEHLTESDIVKLEIAKEIGVYDKVLEGGWRCLSAKESGRIGGILSRKRKLQQKEEKVTQRDG